jgi:hypothetical protein
MRAFWPLLAFSLVLSVGTAAQADSQPLKLDDYRLKALLPAVCSQYGGTINYATRGNDCKLPTVTSKIPTATTTSSRALPITTRQ